MMAEKKYHFIYRITNEINGMFYIGVHSTDDIEDGYMGSGAYLKRDIKEFGAINFKREILFHYNNRHDAFKKEAELVTKEFLANPKTYNLVCGGMGGLKTIRDKVILFNRKKTKEIEIAESVFERYNNEIYYKFSFANSKPFELRAMLYDSAGDYHRARLLRMLIDKFGTTLNDMYNNKFTHRQANVFLLNAIQYKGIKDNIVMETCKWGA